MWTKQQIARLTALWATGLSASQVAAEIGSTRGAVLGKLYRIGAPERTVKRRRKPYTPRKPREPRLRDTTVRPPPRYVYNGHRKPKCVEQTKSQLYAMLADAVRNTAAMNGAEAAREHQL
jgi:GcrA cell cycle regulator